MVNIKVRYCKLCLTVISNENDFLFLKLGFDDDSKHEICNVCSGKLFTAQAFKSSCSCTENAISSFANDAKVFPLDLREIYRKERGSEHILDDVKICRLCMQPINNISEFKAINEDQIDMIHKLVPEIDIFIIKEPVTCKPCLDSLTEHCNFLKRCSEMKQNTTCISNEQVTGASSHSPSVDAPVNIEDVMKFEEDIRQLIKAEHDDMNYEKNDQSEIHGQQIASESAGCKYHPIQCNECNFCNYKTNGMFSLYKDAMKSRDEKLHTYEAGIENHKTTNEDPWKVQVYKYGTCNYETRDKFDLGSHILVHESPSETDYKTSVKNHVLNDKDSTGDVSTNICKICLHKAKRRRYLQKHMLTHKDPSELHMYKCEVCNYETKYKGSLVPHMLIHKDPADVQMYKCKNCNYETKYKGQIKLHTLKHKDPTEVQMYKCQNCNYESRYKPAVRKHMVIHKNRTEVRMHKCTVCDFQTKYKVALKRHVIIHKTPSEVPMYKCENCDFVTKHQRALKGHMLVHKDPTELRMYKCEYCNFETKHKTNLKPHMLTHKTREVQT